MTGSTVDVTRNATVRKPMRNGLRHYTLTGSLELGTTHGLTMTADQWLAVRLVLLSALYGVAIGFALGALLA